MSSRAHNLAIEQGRHTNTPINNRNCKLCHSDIEDEFHFVMKCPHFHDISDVNIIHKEVLLGKSFSLQKHSVVEC